MARFGLFRFGSDSPVKPELPTWKIDKRLKNVEFWENGHKNVAM
jgi:hypothetical protein